MNVGVPVSKSKTQYFINQTYVQYVLDSGHTPIPLLEENYKELFSICEALLLPGGIDIDPTYYGEDNYSSIGVDPEKDAFEREIFYMFANEGKPIFGICRGFQLIMREFLLHNKKFTVQIEEKSQKAKYEDYISFHQNINGHSLAQDRSIERNVPSHSVHYVNNELYSLDTPDEVVTKFVNSMHHQCVTIESIDKKKDNNVLLKMGILNIIAVTAFGISNKSKEYVVEAISFKPNDWSKSHIIAVQWHPEELKDYALLKNMLTKYHKEL